MESLTMDTGSSCLREDGSPRMGKLKIWVSAYALALAFSVSIAVGQSTIGIDGPTPTKSRIVFLGDSLTAGLGVGPDHAFPGLIAEKIRTRNLPFEVVNAGVSG